MHVFLWPISEHKGERQGWLVGGRGWLWVGGWWFISVCWPSVVSALQKLGHIGEQLLDGGILKKLGHR